MRQAGLKPKNHNSGIYWMRASNAAGELSGKGSKGSKETTEQSFSLMQKIIFPLLLFPIFMVIFPFVYIGELYQALKYTKKSSKN
jgi:hypothetical protein